jgi:hypothetical protein
MTHQHNHRPRCIQHQLRTVHERKSWQRNTTARACCQRRRRHHNCKLMINQAGKEERQAGQGGVQRDNALRLPRGEHQPTRLSRLSAGSPLISTCTYLPHAEAVGTYTHNSSVGTRVPLKADHPATRHDDSPPPSSTSAIIGSSRETKNAYHHTSAGVNDRRTITLHTHPHTRTSSTRSRLLRHPARCSQRSGGATQATHHRQRAPHNYISVP